jgi:superfamily II DNA or RNA helicase
MAMKGGQQLPLAIEITKEYVPEGIILRGKIRAGLAVRPLVFPILDLPNPAALISRQSELATLTALNELWMNCQVDEHCEAGEYLLPYGKLDAVHPETRRALGIPERAKVRVLLQAHSAVGTREFAIRATVVHPTLGRLPLSNRQGQAIPLAGDNVVILEEATGELLSRVADTPKEVRDQFLYVAQVKALAARARAELDEYLQRENYYFPRKIDVEVESSSPDCIQLRPVLPEVPPELDPTQAKGGYVARSTTSGRRERVFIPPEVQETLETLKQTATITGTKVPRFVTSPAAFLPEYSGIDLDEFSDRVKSLGIRTYNARPYVRLTPRAGGWFDIETGVNLEDNSSTDTDVEDTPSESSTSITTDDLVELSKLADPDDPWVLKGGKWIYVPSSAEDFADASRELARIAPDGRVRAEHLKYILEIYTNIDELDYDAEFARFLQDYRAAGKADDVPLLPTTFRGQLRSYQMDGLRWLTRLQRVPMGGLLADEMGLGKTVQVLAFMAWLAAQGQLRPSLVVGPQALVDNWCNEIRKFFPTASVYQHVGYGRLRDAQVIASFDIVATTYETLVRDELLLGRVDWNVVVCDEAQRIKNYTTSICRVSKAMKGRVRLALTGTPVENSLGDLWSIVDYAQPGILGSYRSFRERFEKPLVQSEDEETRHRVEKDLMAHLGPAYLRRTKAEYLKDELPPKEESRIRVPYSTLQKQLDREIRAAARSARGNDSRGWALRAVNSLLDLCAHPYLIDDRFRGANPAELLRASPKLSETVRILRAIRERGEKALIFTHNRDMQEILRTVMISEFGILPPVINGDSIQRFGTVEHFNNTSGFAVMILSPRAAGVGLTITGANHVIHYTRWWNPAIENQATDRAHRIGQTKPVYVYVPIVRDDSVRTADEILDSLLEKKRALAESIVIPSSQLQVTEREFIEAMGLLRSA